MISESSYGGSPGEAKRELQKQVESRFGVLPNFFRLAPETPEITEKLWAFAQIAYLDNPLPSLFKERLFVYLSRFCAVRYCIARHVGFLVGLGRPSGDARERTQSAEDVVLMLRRKFLRGGDLEPHFSFCVAHPVPLADIPSPDSKMEDAIFAFASHVFLQTADAPACQASLERLLGAVRLQYLILFMAFVRTAHYWTETHPELVFEDDIKQLLATHEALASCIMSDPEGVSNHVSQRLLDELPALRERADRAISLLAAIVDSTDDAVVSKRLDGIITTWNQGAEWLFGYTAEEAVGQHISLIIPNDRIDEEVAILDRLGRGERIQHFDTVRLRKDGSTVPISVTISPVRDRAGRIVGASKVARNITDRKQAERALRESEERYRMLADSLKFQVRARTSELEQRNVELLKQSDQLRDLSKRLFQSQDDERRRIARELHDDIGQRLALLAADIQQIKEGLSDGELRSHMDEVEKRTSEISADMQSLSRELHSSKLEYLGLALAMESFCKEFADKNKATVHFDSEGIPPIVPQEITLCLFRVIQEGLRNAVKHSGVRLFEVKLHGSPTEIRLTVRDSGMGFDPEVARETQGLGLISMQERVRLVKGTTSITSRPQSGTEISVRVPLAAGTPTEQTKWAEVLKP